MKMLNKLSLLSMIVTIAACGGGGGGSDSHNYAGTWQVNMTINRNTCALPFSAAVADKIIVNQDNEHVIVDFSNITYVGKVGDENVLSVGARITDNSSYVFDSSIVMNESDISVVNDFYYPKSCVVSYSGTVRKISSKDYVDNNSRESSSFENEIVQLTE